jgi:hypothetical protein
MRDDLSRGLRDALLILGPLSDAEQQRNRRWVDFLRDEGGTLRQKAEGGRQTSARGMKDDVKSFVTSRSCLLVIGER